jgi:two-component system nitrogen regulation sensor histidine kinase NtrY
MSSRRRRRSGGSETASKSSRDLLAALRHPRFERRLRVLTWAIGVPAFIAAMVLVWSGGYSGGTRWAVTLIVIAFWAVFVSLVHEHVVYPLRVVANLLQALREGDYSLRARHARQDDALGEVLIEVNTLSETLKSQRLGAMEAGALLRRVVAEIDVAILTFDENARLQLVNRAGERLLGGEPSELIGSRAEELGLAACLEGEDVRTLEAEFPGGRGRWALRRSSFREEGRPHQLVVLTDLSRALREEERMAWQRLIRVLAHELNNSLAPIQSMASTLISLLDRRPRSVDWEKDLRGGLKLISDRSASLSRFVGAYSQLARLPRPRLAPVDVGDLVHHVAGLETRVGVRVEPGPELTIDGDRSQLEQLLINLVRNGADAALETAGEVILSWRTNDAELEIRVDDTGPGLPNTANLFVPFFTTKPNGSGIGLVLCRQIAESHGGTLTLRDHSDGEGCRATLYLPQRSADRGVLREAT